MKILFLIFVVLFFALTPVYGQLLSDATGLVNRLNIQTSGHTFEVEITSNFDIPNFKFDKDEKKLTLYITSGLKNNLGEVIIPLNLLGGNLTFYLNDQEYFPLIKTNDKISFVTLNFTGSEDNTLDIVGTTYLSDLIEISSKDMPSPNLTPSVDYDSLYLIIILLLIGGFAYVIISISKKRKQKI